MKSKIEAWIKRINERPEIEAINIGLLQTETGYQAYLIGSCEYDTDDDDWACNENYVPADKYLDLPHCADLTWEALLNSVLQSLSEFMAQNTDSILHHVPIVTVGFDDGELIRIK